MKGMKYLYTESYKTLLREIKGDLRKWEVYFVHALEDLVLVRFLFAPNGSIESV